MRTCGQGQLGLRLHLVEEWTSPALQLLGATRNCEVGGLKASLTEALDEVYRGAEPILPAAVREIEG